MLYPLKKIQSAIETMIWIASQGSGQPLNSKELCCLEGESARYLEPVMQLLVHHGLLRSVRGPKGGYVLARERRKITLGDIAAIICTEENTVSPAPVSAMKNQLSPLWGELDALLMQRLHAITLEEMCQKTEGTTRVPARTIGDFII